MKKSLLLFVVLAVFVSLVTACGGSGVKTEQPATRIITVGGTGTLENENDRWFVRAQCQPLVELGAIDNYTQVRGYTHEAGAMLGRLDLMKNYFVGHRVTIVATMEAAIDNEEVFRPIRTRRLEIFRHSDGLPEQ